MTEPWRRPGGVARLAAALLVGVLAVTLALRLWAAAQDLDSNREFDERFSFKNVATLLLHHELRPQNAYYPSLSYLPQAAALWASETLSQASGIESLSVFAADRAGWSATAYVIVRGISVLYALASLWLTYRLGRRLFSPAVGLLAAAALAATQRHIVSSAQFKPDMLVVLLTVVGFGWALDAALQPTLGRYARAGVGVGLAVAAKYTGIAAALPIAAAGVWRGWRDRRQWLWLIAAGLISIATFVALNPFLGQVLGFVPNLVHGYDTKGASVGSGHLAVLQKEIRFLVEHQGWFVTVFLALGVLGLLLGWGGARSELRRIGGGLLLAQFLGYSFLHAGFMNLFRAQNYLPVAPFSALIAAWAMVETWRFLAARQAGLARPTVAATLLVAATAFFVARQAGIVYERVVPSTWSAAGARLAAVLPKDGPRYVAFENAYGPLQLPGRPEYVLRAAADRLAAEETDSLDRTDAEVFPLERLEGPNAGDYRQRIERVFGADVLRVERRFMAAQGPGFAIVLHPWQTVDSPVGLALGPGDEAGVLRAALPAPAAGVVATLVLWVPRGALRLAHLRLEPGGDLLDLDDLARDEDSRAFATDRVRLPAAAAAVELRDPVADPAGAGVRLELWRWRPPAPAVRTTN